MSSVTDSLEGHYWEAVSLDAKTLSPAIATWAQKSRYTFHVLETQRGRLHLSSVILTNSRILKLIQKILAWTEEMELARHPFAAVFTVKFTSAISEFLAAGNDKGNTKAKTIQGSTFTKELGICFAQYTQT